MKNILLGVCIIPLLSCIHLRSEKTISTEISSPKYAVKIYRDTWGVPHVFGKTDADAAYGLAYANAEDDFKNMQDALLAARGTLAAVYGKDKAPNDYMVSLLEIWPKVEAGYERDLSVGTRQICEAYAAGVNQFIQDYPDQALPGIYPVRGEDLVAGFVHKTPLFFGIHKALEKMVKLPPEAFLQNDTWWEDHKNMRDKIMTKGSNVFAVSPVRSEKNSIHLAINSHQPWDGPFAWYEAHVNSVEGWNMYGGLFPGSPVILVGHNDSLGWGHTVNNPDLIDVYELEMHPEDPYLYKFDGEWKELRRETASIKVKIFGPFSWTFKRETLYSVHGPVIKGDHAVYAVRYANYDDIRVIEQWYRMNKARNLSEWESAMEMTAIPMFGTGYADKDGNILYLYNAKLPLRNENYNWQGVLPGDISETLWEDYLPFEKLPLVMNPPSGFIQNCNNTPYFTTTGNANPKKEDFSPSFGIESSMSNRAYRSLELFGGDPSISPGEFEAYKFDTYYSESSYMMQFVQRIIDLSDKFTDEKLLEGIKVLKSWNRNTDSENIHTSLPVLSFGWFMESDPQIIQDENLIDSFTFAVKYLYEHYGKLEVAWGKINRLVRGSFNEGLSGGPDISHAVYGMPTEDGILKGFAGDAFLMLVEWDNDGSVTSKSIHQYGSNTQDASSHHYADQAALFAKRQLKPVWRNLSAIKENLEKVYIPGANH